MKHEAKSLFIKFNQITKRLWRKVTAGRSVGTPLRDPELSHGLHGGVDPRSFFSTSEDLAEDTEDKDPPLQACRSRHFMPAAWKSRRAKNIGNGFATSSGAR